MAKVAHLKTAQEMRALWDHEALNVTLSRHCGPHMSVNCLLICHTVTEEAGGDSDLDRSRLNHDKQVAIAFRLTATGWWWGWEGRQTFYPTLGAGRSLPPLRYMDTCAIFVPAEQEWREAASRFPTWSMCAQPDQKLPKDV